MAFMLAVRMLKARTPPLRDDSRMRPSREGRRGCAPANGARTSSTPDVIFHFMVESENKPRLPIGTPSYDNWRAFNSGERVLGEYEYLMFTDARLTGEVTAGLGPYAFFNLVASIEEPRLVRPAVALRLSIHASFDSPRMDKTDLSRYHGGLMEDEIAALASLKCGVRFRSGGQTRRFDAGGDPRGRPVAWSNRPDPEPDILARTRAFVLPSVTGEHSLMPIEEMKSFPSLAPNQEIGLVRSARLYQDALWLSESEPNLSWLMLVSAVETAANLWRSANDSPLECLKLSRNKFVKSLESTGVPGLPELVANEFTDSIGATKKFVDFLLEFIPHAPEKRPPKSGQVDWSRDSLRRAFAKIYDHRSKALHTGIPFPAPMCRPPAKWGASWEAVEERPMPMAVSVYGGTWLAKDMPMLLHTFEYIARRALNAWWSSLASPASCTQQETVGPS